MTKNKKRNVYLFEINDVLTNQIKLPYSTGLIWSYCKTIEEIDNNYNLAELFWWRKETDEILNAMSEPSVVGFSCFVWNWNYNVKLAEAIKQKWPDCLVVFGGWQQPTADRNENFFKRYPFVDIAVHGEGEITFSEILLERLKESPSFENVAGCSIPVKLVSDKSDLTFKRIENSLKIIGQDVMEGYTDLDAYATAPRARISDLSSMPSPYLDGLFDELIKDCPYDLEATIETTRGCPYQCTFCEIGTKYYQKIKTQSLEKVYKEIDWISDNKVVFVYNADSNFGMLPDHLEITKYFVKKKKETGYPDKHRCDWAKNKADKVIELAKLFYDASMDKGITIALQSMNPETLKAVRRKNVDNGKLGEFLKMYSQEELPSYVELILGLPEETVDSFVDGICNVMELGQHNYIGIYPLTALPNTPYGDKKYLEQYGLNIVPTYPAFSHVDVNDQNDFEREHMVVGSNTMTKEEYVECTVWRWLFMFGHYLGSTQYIARFVNKHCSVSFKQFYSSLKEHIENNPDTFLGQELALTKHSLEEVLEARHPWGRVLPDVRANFAWDFEEATVMRISQNREKFNDEMRGFLKNTYSLEDNMITDILEYQDYGTVDPARSYPSTKKFSYNIHDVIFEDQKVKKVDKSYIFTAKEYGGNLFEWGKETLWWGRRVAANKIKPLEEGSAQ